MSGHTRPMLVISVAKALCWRDTQTRSHRDWQAEASVSETAEAEEVEGGQGEPIEPVARQTPLSRLSYLMATSKQKRSYHITYFQVRQIREKEAATKTLPETRYIGKHVDDALFDLK